MVKRSRDQQRSSRSVTPHVVEGFGRVAKRRPDSDRKREPAELDEPRHFRKRFGFRSKDAWAEQKIVREIMVFLHSNGVGTARAVRIFKTYGADAAQVMTEKD